MTTNIFEELKHKREQVKKVAKEALDKSWMNEQDYQELIKKIDNDVLTIGVIGQMKAGKSTFLNAFLFGKEVLPAATTPMTAALSVITYGQQKEIEVEFYTKEEWSELNQRATRTIESAGGDKVIESQIKSAKELVGKAHKIGGQLDAFLGTTKKDQLNNLIEYVGAEGKFVAITKSVTIFYPEEWLKGVRIVDTPGFNDPIVSREQRTEEFLKEADAVLLLLYAGRPFDATDREILFEKVRKVGIGKVLIGINKYDIQYAQGETVEEITDNVKAEIKKACKDQADDTINEMLRNIEPIPFSAHMALMAKTPIDEVQKNETTKFYWDKACDDFEISTSQQMLEKSLIKKLEDTMKETIEKSKGEILLKKPVNHILQLGKNKISDIEEKLAKNRTEEEKLSLSDEQWEEKAREIGRAEKCIARVIDEGVGELQKKFRDTLKHFKRTLEDEVIKSHREMEKAIEEVGMRGAEKKARFIERKMEDLQNSIKRKIEDKEEVLKNETEYITNKNILPEIERHLFRYLGKDNCEDVLYQFKKAIRGLEYNEKYQNDTAEHHEGSSNEEIGFWEVVDTILAGPILAFGGLIDFFNYAWKDDFYSKIEKYKKDLLCTVEKIMQQMEKRADYYLNSIDEESAKQILSNLIDERNKYEGKEAERNQKIAELKVEIEKLTKSKKELSEEFEQIKQISIGIV